MIINTNTHRPQKPELVKGVLPLCVENLALGFPPSKIDYDGSWEQVYEAVVRYSDMDMNGHLNNSRFIDWIFDALSLMDRALPFMELVINYLAEVKEDDQVRILISRTNKEIFVKGERKKDNRKVFMASLMNA